MHCEACCSPRPDAYTLHQWERRALVLQVASFQHGVVAKERVHHGSRGAVGRRLRRLRQRQPPQQVQHPVRQQPLRGTRCFSLRKPSGFRV